MDDKLFLGGGTIRIPDAQTYFNGPETKLKRPCDAIIILGTTTITCSKEIGHDDDEHEVTIKWRRETPRKPKRTIVTNYWTCSICKEEFDMKQTRYKCCPEHTPENSEASVCLACNTLHPGKSR